MVEVGQPVRGVDRQVAATAGAGRTGDGRVMAEGHDGVADPRVQADEQLGGTTGQPVGVVVDVRVVVVGDPPDGDRHRRVAGHHVPDGNRCEVVSVGHGHGGPRTGGRTDDPQCASVRPIELGPALTGPVTVAV